MRIEPTEERFLLDTSKLSMTVLLDNGIYRHVRFKQPGSWFSWFDIVTWPGYLAYTGDMGSFIFTRLEDMFEFFRSRPKPGDPSLYINPQYWAEKLASVDRDGKSGSYKEFSPDLFRKHVEEDVQTWIEEHEAPYDSDDEEVAQSRQVFAAELLAYVEQEIYSRIDDGEYELRRAVNEFTFTPEEKRWETSRTYEFQDSWEWSCDTYTYRFLWCCYALAWGVSKYDESKLALASNS